MTDVEKTKKLVELTKKEESAKREVKQYKEFLESDMRFGRNPDNSRLSLEAANSRLDTIKREIDRLK